MTRLNSLLKFSLGLIFLFPFCTFSQVVNFTDSDLPIILITTQPGDTINDTIRVVAQMSIIDNGPGNRNYMIDPPNDYNGLISIEFRGSTSQQYPKKSYGLETQDVLGNNNNISVLGLPVENDWILYAPFPDKTMIRNVLTYHLARKMGNYASRTRYCELQINSSYRGVYVFQEKLKRDNDRINITELDGTNIAGDELTGGYIIKVDKTTGSGNEYWYSAFDSSVIFQYHDPGDDELLPVQKNYIQSYVYDFEAALLDSNFADPDSGYLRYIEPQTFHDFFILQELGRTVDGYRSSSFLYKNRQSVDGGKLRAGPMWDFNLAYGNANYCQSYLIDGWQYNFNDSCPGFFPHVPFWWKRLLEDSTYANYVRCRWENLRAGPFHTDTLTDFVDSMAVLLDESQQRNFTKWPIIGQYVNWNYFIGNTYQEEIDYLKQWLVDRSAWMDSNITGTCWPFMALEPRTPTREAPLFYPNPFTEYTLLKTENSFNDSSTLDFVLFDLMGKQVFREKVKAGTDYILHRNNLPAGIYIYSISNGYSSYSNGKLIAY